MSPSTCRNVIAEFWSLFFSLAEFQLGTFCASVPGRCKDHVFLLKQVSSVKFLMEYLLRFTFQRNSRSLEMHSKHCLDVEVSVVDFYENGNQVLLRGLMERQQRNYSQ